jgi:hypothetical protein
VGNNVCTPTRLSGGEQKFWSRVFASSDETECASQALIFIHGTRSNMITVGTSINLVISEEMRATLRIEYRDAADIAHESQERGIDSPFETGTGATRTPFQRIDQNRAFQESLIYAAADTDDTDQWPSDELHTGAPQETMAHSQQHDEESDPDDGDPDDGAFTPDFLAAPPLTGSGGAHKKPREGPGEKE